MPPMGSSANSENDGNFSKNSGNFDKDASFNKDGILLECEPYVLQYITNFYGKHLGEIERDYDVKLRVHSSVIEVVSVDDTDLTAELARDKLSQFVKKTAQEVVTEEIALPKGDREKELMQGTIQQVWFVVVGMGCNWGSS